MAEVYFLRDGCGPDNERIAWRSRQSGKRINAQKVIETSELSPSLRNGKSVRFAEHLPEFGKKEVFSYSDPMYVVIRIDSGDEYQYLNKPGYWLLEDVRPDAFMKAFPDQFS